MTTAATNEKLHREVSLWNAFYPVGAPVEYWPGARDMHPRYGVTRSEPWLCGGTVVVACTGHAGGIALSHVQPLTRLKCLTLWQPWASAMAVGAKMIETRSYHGEKLGLREGDLVAIHAAARRMTQAERDTLDPAAEMSEYLDDLPYAAVLSLHRYGGSSPAWFLHQTEQLSAREAALGDYSLGRYGWHLPRVERFETPVPHKGKQGIGYWTPLAGWAEEYVNRNGERP